MIYCVLNNITSKYASVMVGRHSIQNMTLKMTIGVIKKCSCRNNLAITINNAPHWSPTKWGNSPAFARPG